MRYRFAQRHMPPSGAMIVLPSLVSEYSTVMAFDFVTRLPIKPADSRLRRVLVSMRCDTLPSRRRNCPWRWGLSLSENKILGVHLPMKIDEAGFGPGIVCMATLPAAKTFSRAALIWLSHLCSAVATVPSLPILAPHAQLGTRLYLCEAWAPQHYSSRAVLVVPFPPETGLITPLRCAIEPLIHSPDAVDAARIRGIGVVDKAVFERERADTRHLA